MPGQRALKPLVLYFLRLGFLGFGGPAALVGQMEREPVGERGWLREPMPRLSAASSVHAYCSAKWRSGIG